MSTDEGSNSEQAAPTPVLNNLLSKPSESIQETTVQNGNGGQSEQPGGVPPGLPSGHLPPPPHGYHGYPPQFMGRPPFPGYPPAPGYHPGQPSYPYPGGPPMMRPPSELVRMPPGQGPLEWSAQQKKIAEQQPPGTPASVPAPSPAASSIADESNDDKSRLDSPGWPGNVQKPPPSMPPTPHHPGMMMHPGMMPPQGMTPSGMPPSGMPPQGMRRDSIVDKLVGPVTPANPLKVMPERRAFFEKLVAICEQNGDPITMIPQVSKQTVDLHRLYIAVRNKGGFEQVTREKMWKSMCADTNPEISESSAAGYQLRRHYQRHLLTLECMETGKNPEDAIAVADKQKRQRRKEGQTPQPGTPGQPPGPSTSTYPPQSGGDSASQYPPPQQPQQPPYGYGFPPGHPGAPPQYPPAGYPRMPPGVTPMRAPQPQPHMSAMANEEQQNTLQVPNQPQPATPGSQTGPASVQPGTPQTVSQQEAPNSQAGSRAPSVGPNVGSATPDSSSRMSAGGETGEQRPESGPAMTPRAVATPTPGSVTGQPPQMQPQHPMHMPPSTSMAAVQPGQPGAPPTHPGAYYGQPAPMYPNGPGRPGPPGYPPHGYPPHGYHPGPPMPPQHFPPGSHPAAHPSHPQHQQYMQMWQQQRSGYPPQQPGPPRPMPPQAPYGYPPRQLQPPPQQQMQQGAPSPGGSKMRYAPPQQMQQPQHFPTPQQQRPMQQPYQQTPTSQQMQQPIATPAPTPVVSYSGGQTFPPATIEATTISQIRRKRPMARDLIFATPRRLIMALRSGLETEAIWSLNALNVLLYDDTNAHPTLNQMPGLLNVLIEHLYATLSLLFPENFPISEASSCKVSFTEDTTALEELLKDDVKTEVKPIVTARDKDKKSNYTRISRAGRKIQIKDVEMPEILKRQFLGEEGPSNGELIDAKFLDDCVRVGLGGGLAERIAEKLRIQMEFQKAAKEPTFSKHQGICIWDDEDSPSENISQPVVKEEADELPDILIHRKPRPAELLDGQIDFEMKWVRSTALTDRDEMYYKLAMRALSISNIIRGFSFLPGNERELSQHRGVLYIIGRFLHLLAEEIPIVRKPPPKIVIDAPMPDPEPFFEARKKAMNIVNLHDNKELLIVDSVNQLRDDAFVILCHLSPFLDLWDIPGDLSYPIYDGILKWATSSVPEALEPILPAATPIRNYCFEIMCKMSVFERNIDMILSTGAWPRFEKLTRCLAKLTTLGDSTENREFAIVILSSFCLASEPMSYIAALETDLISHLISFIEHHDQAMHQVMQSHGMAALRDNPELMGTSIGMLRRAATLLKHFARIPETHKLYLRNTPRLLQFTMSQLMDSRVAAYVAELLYEIQGTLFTEPERLPRLVEEDAIAAEKQEEQEGSLDNVEIKTEEIEPEQDGHSSPNMSETSSCENTMNSEKSDEKNNKCNGNSSNKKSSKRKNSADNSPPSKRNCLENGFPEKKNGKLEKSIQLKESRAENSSSMAVVA